VVADFEFIKKSGASWAALGTSGKSTQEEKEETKNMRKRGKSRGALGARLQKEANMCETHGGSRRRAVFVKKSWPSDGGVALELVDGEQGTWKEIMDPTGWNKST